MRTDFTLKGAIRMSFAADVKNELCKAEHSRKQLELLSKGAAFAMTEDGDGCFF